jgi:hypothetical protein
MPNTTRFDALITIMMPGWDLPDPWRKERPDRQTEKHAAYFPMGNQTS